MPYPINALDHEHKNVPVQLDRLPDYCPVCSRHIRPIFLTAYLVSKNFKPLSVAFICPVEECSAMFIGIYLVSYSPPNDKIAKLATAELLRHVEEETFPKTIQAISPQFCIIFNQALQAEENKLDQICGPGYRKALEFLVKDFLLSYKFKGNTEKRDIVLRSQLGACINNFVDEERIKAVAKRAAWLGNDETHYYRKWTDKDITDLKALISMTVSWIDLLIQSDKYITDMPE
jgi:hypothetical protein